MILERVLEEERRNGKDGEVLPMPRGDGKAPRRGDNNDGDQSERRLMTQEEQALQGQGQAYNNDQQDYNNGFVHQDARQQNPQAIQEEQQQQF